jgi:preprotein translocase subunit YajC
MAILIIFLPILLFVLLLVSLINSQRRQAKAQETMASAQADIAKYLAKRDT